MGEKYLRENKNSFNIVKKSKIYAKVEDFDDAVFIRDLLVQHDWDLNMIPQIIKKGDDYLVLAIIDEKLHLLARYKTPPNTLTIINLIKNFKRNPNNSEYGLNITRVFDTFVIKKQIAGDDYIFGYYDNFEDARFVRNFLLDHEWNVNNFRQIEFDDETHSYRVVSIIDDHVYVLGNFKFKSRIKLEETYEKFLAKILKHKYGLANYPYLDPLKDKIPYLESRFQVKARDGTWQLNNLGENTSALNEIIFALTPFQQSVYDAISTDTSIEQIEKSLIRYKSKNFTQKILKNTDELVELDLIIKTGENTFSKTNF